ncbi:MAG: CotH kinase family protein [Muribaculaceae bacterium]|nr:CotH kinase family protein [Muribaculaceae bacterium]
MKLIDKATAALLIAIAPGMASGQLIINEIMQSNIDCIMDDMNEFPDSWVELYNSGEEAVQLSDYLIGKNEKSGKAYRLPAGTVDPGQYAIVYCDKVDSGMHASFRLESGNGGGVWLFKGSETVDILTDLKKQPSPNIAYGRITDGAEEWGYQAVPTPGKKNCGKTCKDILGAPVFSVPGGIVSGNVTLSLSLPEDAPEGTVIRYTTDGTEPTDASPVYKDSFKFTKSTVVRAKLFCDGYLSPRSTTHSYINHGREVTLPVVSIVTDKKYFYDNKIGIYVQGNYKQGTPNYEYDWRRPVNYEYFEGAGSGSVINQLCETRVKGGATRSNPLKSLAVYANKRFGEKRFDYEFFPDQTPGISDFKSFEMRDSGNDFDYLYFRDAVIQQCMGMNCDLDWQPARPAIIYINGEYKGILNIRPRSNDDYVYSYYDGLEDIDMLENWEELKTGSLDSFNVFKEFYTTEGHTFAEYEKLMDCGEFCNLMILGVFFDNKDFPGNNIEMWRPVADGGKWRWVAKDADFGMGLYGERYDYKTLNWVTTPGYDNNRNDWANSDKGTLLFRHLLDTPEFKDMWIDRCAVYLGDFLRSDEIIKRIDHCNDLIKFEYEYHRNLYSNPWSWWNNHDQEVSNAKTWTRNRVTFFYKHLADFFNLPAPVELRITDEYESIGRKPFTVNGIELQTGSFSGKYYPGRMLTVSPPDTMNSGHWEVTVTGNNGSETTVYPGGDLDMEMPAAKKVEIHYVSGSTGVDSLMLDDQEETQCEIFDLSGRNMGRDTIVLPAGIYIVKQGRNVRKIKI